jgi:RHS repeat-associated protein
MVISYGYDNNSRLTGITYQFGSNRLGNLTYGYDQLGQRTQVSGSFARTGLPGAVTSATYDAANELTNWNGTSISYDANGNMLGDGSNTFAWNARNQLATLNGAALQYDAFGRRTKNAGGTSFFYDGFNALQELSGSTVTANLLSGGLDEFFTRSDSSGSATPLRDALGNTIGLVDSSGNIATSYSYDPFGNTSISGTTSSNPSQYTGRENEGNGLYYYRARYYSPVLHRFTSEDPLGLAGGGNLYRYVSDDPINRTDPFGLLDVYIWKYRGSTDAWGHASMTLADGTHISWWPSNPRDYKWGTDDIPIYEAPAFPDQTLAKDIEYEGQGPDAIIHIDGMNEDAIKAWWENFRHNHDNKWKTFGRNCSTLFMRGYEQEAGRLNGIL